MITIKIEDDGTITTQCGKVAALDHQIADEYLRDTKLAMGGAVKETKKSPHGHAHNRVQQKAGR